MTSTALDLDQREPGPEQPPFSYEETDATAVAPNWKLVWWRFQEHRLAMFCLFLFIPLVAAAFVPEFFATRDPRATFAQESFIPPQPLRFFHDGRLMLHVRAVDGQRNLETMRMEWVTQDDVILPVNLFGRGYEYDALGFIPASRHLFALAPEVADEHKLYLLGTDRLGRDMWSRLMYGTRISMSIGLVGVALSLFLGVLLGGLSGYFGGVVDLVIQRLIELLQSLPQIPLWLALSAALPETWGPVQVYFAISVILSIFGWTTLGREVRGRFLALREEDFVVAARLNGASQLRVIFIHMVPAMTSHIIATATLAVPAMILSETALSFLGLGLRPPVISWGVLLQEGQNVQSVALASWVLYPGIMVIAVVLILNIIGDGLRDAADPYHSN